MTEERRKAGDGSLYKLSLLPTATKGHCDQAWFHSLQQLWGQDYCRLAPVGCMGSPLALSPQESLMDGSAGLIGPASVLPSKEEIDE